MVILPKVLRRFGKSAQQSSDRRSENGADDDRGPEQRMFGTTVVVGADQLFAMSRPIISFMISVVPPWMVWILLST